MSTCANSLCLKEFDTVPYVAFDPERREFCSDLCLGFVRGIEALGIGGYRKAARYQRYVSREYGWPIGWAGLAFLGGETESEVFWGHWVGVQPVSSLPTRLSASKEEIVYPPVEARSGVYKRGVQLAGETLQDYANRMAREAAL